MTTGYILTDGKMQRLGIFQMGALTFEFGKTYTIKTVNRTDVFSLHESLENILVADLVDRKILEVEILGKCEQGQTMWDQQLLYTDKIKIVREVEEDELPYDVVKNFPTLEYDSKGRVVSRTFKNQETGENSTFNYEYDDDDRMTMYIMPNGDFTSYEYDDKGNLIDMHTFTESESRLQIIIE